MVEGAAASRGRALPGGPAMRNTTRRDTGSTNASAGSARPASIRLPFAASLPETATATRCRPSPTGKAADSVSPSEVGNVADHAASCAADAGIQKLIATSAGRHRQEREFIRKSSVRIPAHRFGPAWSTAGPVRPTAPPLGELPSPHGPRSWPESLAGRQNSSARGGKMPQPKHRQAHHRKPISIRRDPKPIRMPASTNRQDHASALPPPVGAGETRAGNHRNTLPQDARGA